LFHLNQRRGFKSNRKTDRSAGDDPGKIRQGVTRLREAMAGEGARTLGEFLARRHSQRVTVRTRLHGHICDPDRVWVTPGRLTAMLRGKWGLNSLLWDHNLKNRADHRHHAIDAFVIALTDRGLLQRIATAAEQSRDRLIDDMPEPWETFREDLRVALDRLVVSHKADHGTQGQLHEETAYGLVADPEAEEGYNLVSRKPLADLTENEVARIRDPDLRASVQERIEAAKAAGQQMKVAMADYAGRSGIRRVRLLKKEAEVIPIRDGAGRAYKAYSPGDNHRIEIYELPEGRWVGEAVTLFDANQSGHTPGWRLAHPEARFVMKVHKGDLLAIAPDGGSAEIMRVVRLNAKANRLYLAGHNEAGDLQKRHDDPDDPFRWLLASYSKLRDCEARRVRVDALGRLWHLEEGG
jgi:CRISPR-associated endonuclease Csn1